MNRFTPRSEPDHDTPCATPSSEGPAFLMPRLTRRTVLTATLAAAGGVPVVQPPVVQPPAAKPTAAPAEPLRTEPVDVPPVELHWLDGAPAESAGPACGVPWPKGKLPRHSEL